MNMVSCLLLARPNFQTHWLQVLLPNWRGALWEGEKESEKNTNKIKGPNKQTKKKRKTKKCDAVNLLMYHFSSGMTMQLSRWVADHVEIKLFISAIYCVQPWLLKSGQFSGLRTCSVPLADWKGGAVLPSSFSLCGCLSVRQEPARKKREK